MNCEDRSGIRHHRYCYNIQYRTPSSLKFCLHTLELTHDGDAQFYEFHDFTQFRF